MPNLSPGERFTHTFYGRLLLGEAVVGLVLLATVAAVMGGVAPGLFNYYMVENGPLESADELVHAELAFRSAMWISLVIALLVASAVTVVIVLAMVRPLRRQMRELSQVARQVADGDFSRRAELEPGAGEEVTLLASSFNAMVSRLGEVEESRRQLLADLAHELRTPIASLAVTVEALADGVLEADPATFTTLTEQAGRLTRLAGDLRDISDAGGALSVHAMPCEVADLLEQARAAAAEDYARAGVELGIEGRPQGQVSADPQRIGQVLANLLSNALRHTPAGGRVLLAAETDAAGTRITVADTGDGIEPEHLSRVFDRFYRTDAARTRDAGGTGIGLAVSAAIAEAHGGSLTASSGGAGQGSTFTLALPPG